MSELSTMASAIHQIGLMAAEAAYPMESPGQTNPLLNVSPVSDSFASVLKSAIAEVGERQSLAGAEYRAFELGDPDASPTDGVVDGAKAGIVFQESLAVRNKLVSAYTTIMHMDL